MRVCAGFVTMIHTIVNVQRLFEKVIHMFDVDVVGFTTIKNLTSIIVKCIIKRTNRLKNAHLLLIRARVYLLINFFPKFFKFVEFDKKIKRI